jgi:signal transduction histidine kinase
MALVPAFVVLSLGGGWVLSRRALRPVDELTEAARRISLENLSASLPVPPHRDELQRLCEAWNEMLRRLDTSTQQLKQVMADASHELRSPVALIRTTAELALRRDRPATEYREALQKIQTEAEEITQVIENLSELARADSGQLAFSFSRLDVRDILQEVRPHIEPLTAQQRINLQLQVPEEELPVRGDRSALKRVLLVLIDNAIKFTSALGRVAVRGRIAADEIVVEVEDTGVGISNHGLPHIFDLFTKPTARGPAGAWD